MKQGLLSLFALFLALGVNAQTIYNFDFETDVVVTDGADTLTYAWASGINNAEFNEVDLNLDGIKDLVIFEDIGSKVLPFVKLNGKYEYKPEYATKFPPVTRWLKMVDFNCDGKEDIFTHHPFGIYVYENTSTTELSFNLLMHNTGTSMVSFVPSLFNNGSPNKSNLAVLASDVPGIADVDNDGDIDILSFGVIGSGVEFHENVSANPCEMDFRYDTRGCWGSFREGSLDNKLQLDSCGYYRNHKAAHSGSTILMFDSDGNGQKDILLGDVSFNNLVLGVNTGEDTLAHVTSSDTAFPGYDIPADITLFPSSWYMDVDNDGLKDLIASPHTAGSENYRSVWFYKNSGANNNPVFGFVEDNFMQKDMIDVGEGAMPVLYDYDKDGLTDLLISNYGYHNNSGVYDARIAYFRNTGTATDPKFDLITRDFLNLSSLGLKNSLYPTFGDLDGDTDDDLILGDADGNLQYLRNTGTNANPIYASVTTPNFEGIDVGNFATPFLVDLNSDNLLDLVIGGENGRLAYFENTGSINFPAYTNYTNTLGDVDVRNRINQGYSVPYVFMDSTSGNFQFFVGNVEGTLYHYTANNGTINDFTLMDSVLTGYDYGLRSAPTLGHLNGDEWFDMVVGGYAGGVELLYGDSTDVDSTISIDEEKQAKVNLAVFPNPTSGVFTVELQNIAVNDIVSAEVYNIMGAKITDLNFKGSKATANLSSQTNGIYLVRIETRNAIVTKRISIQH